MSPYKNFYYATMRGTVGDFKRDVEGSDKRFGFILPKRGSSTVAVFESPVDTLSHKIMHPRFGGWHLSLGGTSIHALTHFLERHGETKSIIICVDNDETGDRAAKKIRALKGISAIRILPPYKCKDWNNALLSGMAKPSIGDRLKNAEKSAAEYNSANSRQHRPGMACDRSYE